MNTEIARDAEYSLKPDVWLTARLGCAAWKVETGGRGAPLGTLDSAEPLFAYARIPTADVRALWRLGRNGFRVVDVALTLEGAIASTGVGAAVRFARPADRETVARIAGTAFRYSRFHLDPLIPSEIANAIKSEWAANYFNGKRGDGMVVAERDGRVAGFLQLLWEADERLLIDLIAVDPADQGQGIGRDMIRFASQYGTGDHRRPKRIKVGTQAANTSSVRLYESLGLCLVNAQYVLHYHAKPSAT